ncbi:hypothetical protein Ahy_A10g048807 [Arachis hypogaea]|uniref:Transposase MuDR plant domain-containing protein n=1 Tax=Arachis hypogaea TaxID=3818 RepID=A0A445B5X8_ARAHY|nr:hypothetical protein Ahy_A10g048807 [Arachis hypogaea]
MEAPTREGVLHATCGGRVRGRVTCGFFSLADEATGGGRAESACGGACWHVSQSGWLVMQHVDGVLSAPFYIRQRSVPFLLRKRVFFDCVSVMEGTTNLVVYHNGEIIQNTHEKVRFVCQNPFSFGISCTMMFMEHQNGLCQSMEKESDGIQNDLDIENDRAAVYKRMNSDSEEDFEATYEAGDENEDGDVGVEAAAKNIVVHPSVSQPMNIPPFMHNLDLDIVHALKFSEYANIGVADPKDGEFKIGMEYSSRKSVVTEIRSYTISRGVDYNVYESKPQMFYTKCKTYGQSRPLYNGSEEVNSDRILYRVFGSFNPCIRAFRHCKLLVQVDGIHLYEKYKGTLLVGVAQDGNQNIVPITFALRLDWQLYEHDVYKMIEVPKGHSQSLCPQRVRPSGAGDDGGP